MMSFDFVVVSAQMQRVTNDSGSSSVALTSCKYNSLLLPLPSTSPPRDDLFIDDTSDVDANDRYMFLS